MSSTRKHLLRVFAISALFNEETPDYWTGQLNGVPFSITMEGEGEETSWTVASLDANVPFSASGSDTAVRGSAGALRLALRKGKYARELVAHETLMEGFTLADNLRNDFYRPMFDATAAISPDLPEEEYAAEVERASEMDLPNEEAFLSNLRQRTDPSIHRLLEEYWNNER